MATIHPAEEEYNHDTVICSLQCLIQWADEQQKHYPGLWLNGKTE